MDAKRLFNMERLKFAEHVMVLVPNQEQEQLLVMHVEDQECKLFDKDQ